jgi:uncharacterized membrane-anchored protein YjiN (DUF445 family)
MKRINSKVFGFSFFLSSRAKVDSLEQAAREHGGATKNYMTGELYSNIVGSDFIEVKTGRDLNTISLFIPDTISINQQASKEEVKRVISHVVQKIYRKYEEVPTIENGLGSWFSDELQEVVFDNLIITSVHIEDLTEDDINFFIQLAKYIKKEMKQEAVSININSALALI